jgi:hypothetical protein
MTNGDANLQVLSEYKYKWADIFFLEEEIVEVHLLPGWYNAEKVLGTIDKIKSLSDRSVLLVLTVTNKKSKVTWSGFRAVFSKTAQDYSIAKAYLFHNRMQFFLANIGRIIFRPEIPIRFFKDKKEAFVWLSTFRGYGV